MRRRSRSSSGQIGDRPRRRGARGRSRARSATNWSSARRSRSARRPAVERARDRSARPLKARVQAAVARQLRWPRAPHTLADRRPSDSPASAVLQIAGRDRCDRHREVDAIAERTRQARGVARRPAAACSGTGDAASPRNPHGHGFIAPTSMKRAGKTAVRAARAMRTHPSSSGCRSTSSTCRLNSGISSRKSTPWCARLISPGRGMLTAADERDVRDRVMRRAKRPLAQQPRAGRQQAGDRVNRRRLERFVEGQRRQDRRDAVAPSSSCRRRAVRSSARCGRRPRRSPARGARAPGRGRRRSRRRTSRLDAGSGRDGVARLRRNVRRIVQRRDRLGAASATGKSSSPSTTAASARLGWRQQQRAEPSRRAAAAIGSTPRAV